MSCTEEIGIGIGCRLRFWSL